MAKLERTQTRMTEEITIVHEFRRMGLSPLGALQATKGRMVTNADDRLRIAELLSGQGLSVSQSITRPMGAGITRPMGAGASGSTR